MLAEQDKQASTDLKTQQYVDRTTCMWVENAQLLQATMYTYSSPE